jgi:hypothetical protein
MAFQLGSNFELKQQVPLDTRTVVSNQTELNALIGTNQVYPGLIVYVTSENKYYYRNTSNAWIELNITGLSDFYPKADAVLVTGNQTITGVKTFADNTFFTQNILLNRGSEFGSNETQEISFDGRAFIKWFKDFDTLGISTPGGSPSRMEIRNGSQYIYLDGDVEVAVYASRFHSFNGEAFAFSSRPEVNGSGVLLQGEAAGGENLTNVVFTTGTQTITGPKNFTARPTFNNLNLITTGDLINLEFQIQGLNNIVYTTGTQTISGLKIFENQLLTPEIRGTGLPGLNRKIDLQEGQLYAGTSIVSLDYWDRILSGQWKTNQKLLINNTGVLLSGEAVDSNGTINRMIKLTQAEYNTLSPKDPKTFYVIVG